MADLTLKARTAFDGLLAPAGDAKEPGVRVAERADLSIATVLARKGQGEALAAAVSQRHGLGLPAGPARAAAGDLAFVSTGPGAWLALREGGGYGLAPELGEALRGLASVSDQTDGFAVLRLSGPRVRDVFAKGIHLDFDPGVFPVGTAAATDAGHIGIVVWRLDDGADGHPVFEVALFRSFAESFWRWLSESAAEYGLAVEA